jgi:hypothetical protein
MYPPTGDFSSDFVRNRNIYAGNAIRFGIRSDPFSEVLSQKIVK